MIETLPLTRRRFNKLTAAAVAASAIGLGVVSPEARATMVSVATLLFIDPVTLEYKIFGPCCYFCPDYMIAVSYTHLTLPTTPYV